MAKACGWSQDITDADQHDSATVTQNGWLPSSRWQSVRSLRPVTSSISTLCWSGRVSAWIGGPQAARIAPVMRPVTSSGELSGDRLVGDLGAAPHHHDPVADREHVGHAVADQDDRDALVA